MIILPAIDLKGGQCVRLYQGSFETASRVADSVPETAAAFARAGARWIHMVDLDGAKSGHGVNRQAVAEVARTSGLRVELGGGLRTLDDLRAADALGVERMILGSAAVEHPEFVQKAVECYGERIAVGIDARDGRVRTAGWLQDSGVDYLEFARQMEQIGVKTIIFTDIDTDGTLRGPSYERLGALRDGCSCRIIASGGVGSNADLVRLREMGLYGAIVGKAYYTGAVDLKAAVEEGGDQTC